MAQVLYRPNFIGHSLLNITADAQQRAREDEERHRQAEAKRKKFGIMAGVGAATLGAGFLAAPAVAGIAGTAGTAGTMVGGVGIPGTLATSGLFGTGGAISGLGALQLAALGGGIGSQFANEDYAGALGSVAGTAGAISQASDDIESYGFKVRPEDRHAMAQQAARLGISLGALQQASKATGVSVPQLLSRMTTQAQETAQWDSLARDSNYDGPGFALQRASQSNPRGVQGAISDSRIRAGQDAAEVKRLESKAEFDQTMQNLYGTPEQPGGWEAQPDQSAVNDLHAEQTEFDDITNAFEASGGRRGRPPSELAQRSSQINAEMQKALQGSPAPRRPTIPIFGPDGQQKGSRPLQGDFEREDGSVISSTVDEKGFVHKQIIAKPGPKMPKTPQEVSESMLLSNVPIEEQKDYAWDGDSWAKKKTELDPEAKFNQDLISDAIKKSDDPSMVAQFVRAGQQARQLPKFEATVDEQVLKIGSGTLTMDDYAKIRKQAAAFFPALDSDPALSDIRNKLSAIGNDAAQTASQAAMAMQAQQSAMSPPPPPPGSAASAEAAGAAAARVVKKVPAAIAAVPAAIAAVPAAGFELAGKGAKGITEGVAGFINEMAGVNDLRTPEGRTKDFEKIQKRNIEGGIDDTVLAVDAKGNVRPWRKGDVTAEVIAEQKSYGFTFPGLD